MAAGGGTDGAGPRRRLARNGAHQGRDRDVSTCPRARPTEPERHRAARAGAGRAARINRMSSKKSLLVYFVTHLDGRITGILLRTWDWFFDRRPPSAYGTSEEDVFEQLEADLHAMAATREDSIDRYLWEESFDLRSIEVEVHPQTTVKKQ